MAESDVHSFIVKVWVEKAARRFRRGSWHGYITHVPSGERRYLKDLDGIKDFILPYVRGMSADDPFRLRAALWLRRTAARLRR